MEFVNRILPIVYWIVFTIVHAGGLVVSIVLLNRTRRTPATLATAAFGLLLVQDLGRLLREIGLDFQLWRLTRPAFEGIWEISNCCCGLLQLAGIACLAVALWQALSGPTGEGSTELEEVA
jgi:hypothetical protein